MELVHTRRKQRRTTQEERLDERERSKLEKVASSVPIFHNATYPVVQNLLSERLLTCGLGLQ